MARTPFVAGNWKMHKTPDETASFCKELAGKPAPAGVEVAVFPPFPALAAAAAALRGGPAGLGAQNMHPADKGAYTGEVSASMLLTLGCQYVILGHSERRALFGETDTFIFDKVKAAQAAGLVPLLCVGEQLEEREAGRTEAVVFEQLALVTEQLSDPGSLVVAYEPVWAIGTGVVATPEQAQEVHASIRERLRAGWGEAADGIRILYGGSVKPDNAASLLGQADIDGALIGGAALEVKSFWDIVESAG